jgi:signal transduction histidine kinase
MSFDETAKLFNLNRPRRNQRKIMPHFSCYPIPGIRPGRYASQCLLLSFILLALAWPSYVEGQQTNNEAVDLNVVEPYTSPTNGLGSWIWEQVTLDNQTCRFWKAIEIPEGITVTNARLVMTVDNEFTLYLDGRELGRGAEWRELFIFDVTPLLTPGRHILAVDAYNGSFSAGMLLGLRASFANGKSIEYKSDKSWRIVPDGVRQWQTRTEAEADWPEATIIAPLGGAPWWTSPTAVNMMPSVQPAKLYFWQTGWFQILLFSLCVVVVLTSLWLLAQLVVHRKESLLLQSERGRIARDIHDDIGSRMTQLVLHGEVLQNQLPADSEMSRQLTWICEEVRGLLSTMDEILWAVNPRRDTLRDFADYVCNYAQQFLKPTRIQVLFAVEPEIPAAELNLPLRRSLLMAIKEALNNAVRHSGATELCLQIKSQGSRLIVAVQDNGKGFDIRNATSEGNGLTNMSQRLSELGGSCQVISRPGKGCRVEFSIPLKRRLWSQILKLKPASGLNNDTGRARTKSPAQSHDPTQC